MPLEQAALALFVRTLPNASDEDALRVVRV